MQPWIGGGVLFVVIALAAVLGRAPRRIADKDWPRSPPEPLAYMSSRNYRGLRSPWSALAMGAFVTGCGVWMMFALITGHVNHLHLGGIIIASSCALLFTAGGLFLLFFIGIRRLRWLRAVGFSSLHPPVHDVISSWATVLPDSSRSTRSMMREWLGARRKRRDDSDPPV